MALSPILWICARLPILSNLELVVYLIQCIIVIEFKLMSFSPCRTPVHNDRLEEKSLSNPYWTPRYHSLRSSARPKYCTADSVDLNKGRSPAKKNAFFQALPVLGWCGGRVVGAWPNFLAPFQEVHFWSIKGVHFFQNSVLYGMCNIFSP